MKEQQRGAITGSSVRLRVPCCSKRSDKRLRNAFLLPPVSSHVPGAARGTPGFFHALSVNLSNDFCDVSAPALQRLLHGAPAQKPDLVQVCCCDAGVASLSPTSMQWENSTLLMGFLKVSSGWNQQLPGDKAPSRLLPVAGLAAVARAWG